MPNYRRQRDANDIRHFDDLFLFNATEDLTYLHGVLLASLKYPRLHSLSTVIHRSADEELRLRYSVPSLRVLKLDEHGRDHDDHMWDGYATFEYVSDDFLFQIQERCPNLESFDVERPQDNSQADVIMRILTATPTIRRLTNGSNTWCTRCDLKEGTAKKAFYYLFTLLAEHTPLQDLSWAMLMYLPRLHRGEYERNSAALQSAAKAKVPRHTYGYGYTDHILFPNLRSLDVKHLSYDEHFPAKYYATMMQYHAPQMWGLLLYYGEFEEEVKTAFSDLRMENYGMERLRWEKAINEYWEGKQTLHYPYGAVPWGVRKFVAD